MAMHQMSPYAYVLNLPSTICIHCVQPNPLQHHKLADPRVGHHTEHLPPVKGDGKEEYEVTSVEESRVYQNQSQCLLRWIWYDCLLWDPLTFLDGPPAIGESHQGYPGKPGLLQDAFGGPQT